MINFNLDKNNIKNQITENKNRLDQIKSLYQNKINIYSEIFERSASEATSNDKIDALNKYLEYLINQVEEINRASEQLENIENIILNDNKADNNNELNENETTLEYCGKLYQNGANNVNIVYGFGENWTNTTKKAMDKTQNGFVTNITVEDFDTFNFCFSNENDEWDNNDNYNYIYKINSKQLELIEDYNFIFIKNKKDIENSNSISVEDLISSYNEKYKNIESYFFSYVVNEENSLIKNINCILENKKSEQLSQISEEENEQIKDNGTLLISEVQNKVVLPYTAEEIIEIIEDENNNYATVQEVIDSVFTRPFDYYRNQFRTRFKEAFDLITKRENMSTLDGISLGSELFGKRYLHPAIISACKSLDELNVYLDCLDKNELDDFKIFEIKYELNPMIVKESSKFFKKISKLLLQSTD